MLETIYIARHGFRLNWLTTAWKSPTGTPRDPPLSAYGEQQAQELATYISSLPENERPTAIFSSPFYRCLQTSAPIAAALNIPIFIENGLSEWYSPVVPGTGLHPIPPAAPMLSSLFPHFGIDADTWSPPTYIPDRRGETLSDVHDRCQTFLRAFIPRVEQLHGGKHEKILLVSHAATVIALTRELMRNRDLPMRVACCSLTTLTRAQGGGEPVSVWKPLDLAIGHFLKGGLERAWGFEDVELDRQEVVNDPGEPGTEIEVQKAIGLQVIMPSRI